MCIERSRLIIEGAFFCLENLITYRLVAPKSLNYTNLFQMIVFDKIRGNKKENYEEVRHVNTDVNKNI